MHKKLRVNTSKKLSSCIVMTRRIAYAAKPLTDADRRFGLPRDRTITHPLIDMRFTARGLKPLQPKEDPPKKEEEKKEEPECHDFVILTLEIPTEEGVFHEVSRTEAVPWSVNPKWTKPIRIAFRFDAAQPCRILVYNVSSKTADLMGVDCLGQAAFDLHDFIFDLRKPHTLTLRLQSRVGNRGEIHMGLRQATSCGAVLSGAFAFTDYKVDKVYLTMVKVADDGEEEEIYRTNVGEGKKKSEFDMLRIPMQKIGDSNEQTRLRFSLFKASKKKDPKLLGTCDTTVEKFVKSPTPRKLLGKKDKPVATFQLAKMRIERTPTLCDYFRSDLQIECHVAIDFTSSNKDPLSPQSLHFRSVDKFNEYESCLNAFGPLLTSYCFKNMFAVYGFGGRVTGFTGNYFPLNCDQRSPLVRGFDGIMNAYRDCLPKIQLSNPTIFSDLIEAIRQPQDERFKSGRYYGILLILVDDVVSDMEETIKQIVESSYQALSIVIVGIGPADFTEMERFSDHTALNDNGKPMKRHNCVFVPFEKTLEEASLRQVVSWALQDIPCQIDEFCKMQDFHPDVSID